ncbi:571_t:CDS:2, partial [Funneliformis mosseae]
DKDSEALLNIQDKEFKELLTYNSAEDFSDVNSTSDKVADTEADIEEDAKLFVGKVFQNWNYASKIMKKAQSTFRNEGENLMLKQLFGSANLSLYELFDAIEERYQEESDYCEFIN